MAKIPTDSLVTWIATAELPIKGKIEYCLQEEKLMRGATVLDHTLFIKLDDGTSRRMSLWGANLQKLVQKLGDETEKWKGCIISISSNGKNKVID